MSLVDQACWLPRGIWRLNARLADNFFKHATAPAQKPIRLWKPACWMIPAMLGVWYTLQPETETDRAKMWVVSLEGLILFLGMGAAMKWMQTERGRKWVCSNIRLLRAAVLVCNTGCLLVCGRAAGVWQAK
jgi:hypothetical protein